MLACFCLFQFKTAMAIAVIKAIVVSEIVLMGVSSLNLTCYSCATTDEKDVCFHNVSEAETQVCDPTASSMTCSVYREDVAGKFTYMIRGCNTSCVAVCGAWGDNVDIDKCSSCCSSDLCNVDDAASSPWSPVTMMVTMVMTLVFEVLFLK